MRKHAQAQATPVAIESLDVVRYQNQPVVTSDLLAKLYGASTKNINDNFLNNSGRFLEGKHFHRLEGDALREFKNYPENIGVVARQTRHLILWTERGAARHAKMLDTDQAWEVFERLEEGYFNPTRHYDGHAELDRAALAPAGEAPLLQMTALQLESVVMRRVQEELEAFEREVPRPQRQPLTDGQYRRLQTLRQRICQRFHLSGQAQYALDERVRQVFGAALADIWQADFARAEALLAELDRQTERFHAAAVSQEQAFICLTVWDSPARMMREV